MAAVTSGAKLVKMLKETGTGDNKLIWARRALHDAKAAGKVATADDVIAAMIGPDDPDLRQEGHLGHFHPTVRKAQTIRDSGKWVDPTQTPKPTIEEELLAAEEAESAEKKPKAAEKKA